jgi:hypothetical protein
VVEASVLVVTYVSQQMEYRVQSIIDSTHRGFRKGFPFDGSAKAQNGECLVRTQSPRQKKSLISDM